MKAADGFKRLGDAARGADIGLRRFIHAFAHHGEGRDPHRCEWCAADLGDAVDCYRDGLDV